MDMDGIPSCKTIPLLAGKGDSQSARDICSLKFTTFSVFPGALETRELVQQLIVQEHRQKDVQSDSDRQSTEPP